MCRGATITLTAANAILTTTTSANVTPAGSYLTANADTITAGGNLSNAFITDATASDGDTLTAAISGAAITAPTITNIETINLTTNQTAATSLVGVTGATAINISGGTSNFTNAQSKPLALSSGYAAGLTANVTTPGNTMGLTVTLNGTAAGAGITSNSTSTSTTTNALALAVAANSTLSTLDMGGATATIKVTGAGNLTITDTSTTGTIDASTMTGTLTANISGTTVFITGSAQADTFSQTAAGTASVNGGAGNDTFAFDTTGTLTTADSINGGDGSDTITTSGWTATTDLANVTNVEVLNLTGNAVGYNYVTADALVAFGQTLTVSGASATGASTLTFNGAAETNGVFNITGTLGADALTGGANGDTITGGNGADTITGGAGNDSVVLTETTAAVDHVRFAHSGALHRDTVTGFTAGSDVIGFSIGNIVDNGGGNDTLSTANGTDIGVAVAAGAATVSFTGAAAGATALANGVNLVVLSNTAATSFATAIGTTTFTNAGTAIDTGFAAGEGMATVWYDTTNSQAVFGYIENTSTVAADVLSAADTFHEVVRVGMTSADFTQANITNSFALF